MLRCEKRPIHSRYSACAHFDYFYCRPESFLLQILRCSYPTGLRCETPSLIPTCRHAQTRARPPRNRKEDKNLHTTRKNFLPALAGRRESLLRCPAVPGRHRNTPPSLQTARHCPPPVRPFRPCGRGTV